ncbi:MAG: malto-oligosyltrehalose trehalohydrolase [Actinomycetota bacterium]
MTLEVWAPIATTVELVMEGRRLPLRRRDDGCWDSDHALEGGVDYRFLVDGGEPRPDPRSPWQPKGVYGPSRTVDHSAFPWTDDHWRGASLADAVVYELHTGTFTPEGTFEAAIERLPHLVELGVTAVELLPVGEFPGKHGWGYDGVDLYAPHHAYGGPDGLKRFADACHRAGLAVIMDVVYNHLGPSGNYLSEFGPYFTDRYSTPWGQAINFDDAFSPGVRNFVIENALMWLRDYHCDGLRLDAVHAILDTSALHILEEIALRVRELEIRLGRTLWVIAESDLNDPRLVRTRDAGGYGLDAQWSDDFHHALHALLTGDTDGYYRDFGTIEHLCKALTNAFVYDGTYSEHRKRRHGRIPTGLGGDRFLAYLQNHDQIGNRAQGERSSALMSTDMLKVAAAVVLTSPFIPMLFQGEEWGASTPFQYFTDHSDEDLGRAVSEGRRREFAAFGWDPADVPDPQDRATFERSKLDWAEVTKEPHADLLEWHRRLIELRKETPALADGRRDLVRARADGDVLVIERGPVTIACNLGGEAAETAVPAERRARLLLSSGTAPRTAADRIVLLPESVSIYSI